MNYRVTETATVLVDHEALTGMLNACAEPGTRAALVGFNEYSKHLLNLSSENIIVVYDEAEWKQGIKFRGITVASPNVRFDINKIIICEYHQLYGFTGTIRRLYEKNIPIYYPPRMHYKSTADINVFEQEITYKSIEAEKTLSPPSMMEQNKLHYLAELMRSGLRNQGDILEMGVYQGGSVWFLAHILKNLGEARDIFMFDLFEKHMMHPNATMCKDEIKRRLSFYPRCHLLEGLVDDEDLLRAVRGKPLCFVHYDLGFHRSALEFAWEHLQPGSPMVLDNYGHLAINPWDLDDFFSDRGAHVTRNPWSEQGVVFKPPILLGKCAILPCCGLIIYRH